jgi:hypothetical protein
VSGLDATSVSTIAENIHQLFSRIYLSAEIILPLEFLMFMSWKSQPVSDLAASEPACLIGNCGVIVKKLTAVAAFES